MGGAGAGPAAVMCSDPGDQINYARNITPTHTALARGCWALGHGTHRDTEYTAPHGELQFGANIGLAGIPLVPAQ